MLYMTSEKMNSLNKYPISWINTRLYYLYYFSKFYVRQVHFICSLCWSLWPLVYSLLYQFWALSSGREHLEMCLVLIDRNELLVPSNKSIWNCTNSVNSIRKDFETIALNHFVALYLYKRCMLTLSVSN